MSSGSHKTILYCSVLLLIIQASSSPGVLDFFSSNHSTELQAIAQETDTPALFLDHPAQLPQANSSILTSSYQLEDTLRLNQAGAQIGSLETNAKKICAILPQKSSGISQTAFGFQLTNSQSRLHYLSGKDHADFELVSSSSLIALGTQLNQKTALGINFQNTSGSGQGDFSVLQDLLPSFQSPKVVLPSLRKSYGLHISHRLSDSFFLHLQTNRTDFSLSLALLDYRRHLRVPFDTLGWSWESALNWRSSPSSHLQVFIGKATAEKSTEVTYNFYNILGALNSSFQSSRSGASATISLKDNTSVFATWSYFNLQGKSFGSLNLPSAALWGQPADYEFIGNLDYRALRLGLIRKLNQSLNFKLTYGRAQINLLGKAAFRYIKWFLFFPLPIEDIYEYPISDMLLQSINANLNWKINENLQLNFGFEQFVPTVPKTVEETIVKPPPEAPPRETKGGRIYSLSVTYCF